MMRFIRLTLCFATIGLAAAVPGYAQVSLTTAVDLALRTNPRVRLAQADVDKARAGLSEARDVYVPNLVGGSGLGYSYGFPVGQPSIFNFQAQSLVFNFSQRDYIRAARSALVAANFALMDARAAVAEDTVLTYIALDHDRERLAALHDQLGFSQNLVTIIQTRLDAGQDTPIDLTTARLSAAQLHLNLLHTEDEQAIDQLRLAHLTGLPPENLATVPASLPQVFAVANPTAPLAPTSSPAVAASFANAKAKREIAFGDARYLYRPQIAFGAQYSRYARYNNYDLYYSHFQQNNAEIGIQITVPFFDRAHSAKARESAADAVHAEREAEQVRDQFTEGRLRVQRTTVELAVRADVAVLDQQLAQQQLDILLVQLSSGNPNGPQMTPKDEQNSRIAEREKYLSVLDARFQVRQAQVNLLRQTGELEAWLKSTAGTQPTSQLNTGSRSLLRPAGIAGAGSSPQQNP